MNSPKVQVIVPVYNAEKYLNKCLDSLKNQVYSNWEAILIDDASTDSSVEIIKEYAKEDNRFTYIQAEKNGGVSNSRNLALTKLTEKYTAFLDSDDYWEDDMLSAMVEKAEQGNFDVVQCRFVYDFPGGKKVLPAGAFEKEIVISKETIGKIYFKMLTGINMNHVCMKLIKTKLLCGLAFDTNLKTAEDLKLISQLFEKVDSYCFIDKVLYHYRRSESSLTGKSLSGKEKLKANISVSKSIKKTLKTHNLDNLYWRCLCDLRPYIIIVSKILRTLREKMFSKKIGGEL